MPMSRENLQNPGIFVRILNDDEYTVIWTTGAGVVEMAYEEQTTMAEEEPITGYLKKTAQVHDLEQEEYDQWGTYHDTIPLRRITLREAVHYLGRNSKICAFLRPKPQVTRFLNALEKGWSPIELKVAKEIKGFLSKFEKSDEAVFAERLADYLEHQLLTITSAHFEL